VTLADAFLIPQLYNARRFGIDIQNYPNITEVENNLSTIDAFISAHPDNQPDFEPNK
jgi:glutathione S-transferase